MDLLTSFATTNNINTSQIIAAGIIGLISIIATWRVFTKAGKPGWAAIIPIYNIYVLLKVVDRPGWWVILYLIPIVDIIVHLVVALDLAKSFGKSTLFGVIGLWIFSLFGMIILGFGESTYQGAPKRAQA